MSKPLVGAPIGADVDGLVAGVISGSTYPTGLGSPMQLGTVVNGIDGTRYVLVQAGSASSAMASTKAANAYAIDDSYRARHMTATRGLAGQGLGFAPQAVIVAHDYFWARIAGTGFNV